MQINWLKLLGHIVVPLAGGFLGAIFTSKEVKPGGWYWKIKRPSWNPPAWLFGPAWTAIYSLMGVASYIIAGKGGFMPLSIYGVNLLLNWAWTPLFFGAKRLDLAMLDITGLWASIIAMIVTYSKVDQTAALCLAPYLAWVSFAACLNYNIWVNNPSSLVGIGGEDEAAQPLVSSSATEKDL